MPISQKRIFEVTMPIALQRMLGLESYTVNELKVLQQELLNFGNEISDVLGSFRPAVATETREPIPVVKAKSSKPIGTAEQRSQILEIIKTKGRLSAKSIAIEIGIGQPLASSIMSSLYEYKQVERVRNPNTVYREYLYELPQSAILVA